MEFLREKPKFNTARWAIHPDTGKVDTLQKIIADKAIASGEVKTKGFSTDTIATRKFFELLRKNQEKEREELEKATKSDPFYTALNLNNAFTKLLLNLKKLLG